MGTKARSYAHIGINFKEQKPLQRKNTNPSCITNIAHIAHLERMCSAAGIEDDVPAVMYAANPEDRVLTKGRNLRGLLATSNFKPSRNTKVLRAYYAP
jgi:transcription initiation factor TFIIIB Brf1 subunit/transcription initiation factor TFIIB